MSKGNLTTVAPQSGKVISVVGDSYRVVAGGEQTDNKYALIDMMIPKGGGPARMHTKMCRKLFTLLMANLK